MKKTILVASLISLGCLFTVPSVQRHTETLLYTEDGCSFLISEDIEQTVIDSNQKEKFINTEMAKRIRYTTLPMDGAKMQGINGIIRKDDMK